MTHNQHTRRTPRQERGEQRVTMILDAAAALFAETGYEATTMSDIAVRAHTSFGSLYQFFPNKQAVVEAVASRYLDQLRAYFATTSIEQIAQASFEEMLDALFDPFVAFVVERPGFQLFLRDAKRLKHLEAAQALYSEALDWVERLLAERAPALDPDQRQLIAMLVVQLVGLAIELAASEEEARNTAAVKEVKIALRAYVRARTQGVTR